VNATIETDGVRYKIVLPDPDDHIQKHLLGGTPYEHGMLRDMAARCTGVVVDVGANVGNHAVYMAVKGFPVFAFEPDETLANCIVESAKLNGLNHLHVAQVALGSEPGMGRLVAAPEGNVGAQSVNVKGGDIPILTLDTFDIPASVIKIDVEGMEFKVLHGAQETIVKHRPLIYIEAHKGSYKRLAEWAKNNGYVRKARFNSSPTYLYVPKEKA
jgi:FkbM family methyltransferase